MNFPWTTPDARLTRLLRQARDGDRDAFRAVYRALYPRVASYVARRSPARQDTEDLVSRTFHRLLERLQTFDEAKGEAISFVLSIARNLLIDDARARRPQVAPDEFDDALAGLAEERTPLSTLLQEEEARELRARLDGLPAQTREMFSLRYGDGLSLRQIAGLLGLSEDAVKQRFSRALRELRQGQGSEPARKGALA